MVLQSGSVAEMGTHDELLEADGVYARMENALASSALWSKEGAA